MSQTHLPIPPGPPEAPLCTRCRKNPARLATNGSKNWCNSCQAEYRREWRRNNRAKSREQIYAASLKRRYGINLERYEEMFRRQGGVCAICGREEYARNKDGTIRRLHLDHDHATGGIRDLLCSGCNVGLGGFDDDPSRLRGALTYLEKWGADPPG